MFVSIRAFVLLALLATISLAGLPAARAAEKRTFVDYEVARVARDFDLTEQQKLRVEELRRDYSAKSAPLLQQIDQLNAALHEGSDDPFAEFGQVKPAKAAAQAAEDEKKFAQPRKKLKAAREQVSALRDSLARELAALLTPEQKSPRARIARALDTPTTIEFVETPLKDVVDYLQDVHHIPIRLDNKEPAKVWLGELAIIDDQREITLQSALHGMLAKYGLVHLIDRDALLITTVEAKAEALKRGAIDPDSLSFPNRDAANARLAQRLKLPVEVRLAGLPGCDGIETLAKQAKVFIRFDEARVTRRDMAADLTIDARGEPLHAALNSLFAAQGLTCSIRDEAIVIAPQAAVKSDSPWAHHGKDWINPDEDAVVAELQRLDADFVLNERGRVEALDAQSREVLAVVPRLKDLLSLDIKARPDGSRWETDADLALVSPAVQITQLRLVGATGIGDEGLKHLARWKRLAALKLNGTKVTDTGLPSLKAMNNLYDLDLTDTKVGDAGMSSLSGLPGLVDLNLTHTRVTDAGLKPLRALKILLRLFLEGDAITDKGLHELEGMPGLGAVWLQRTKVTKSGVERFNKAKPKCAVFWDGNPYKPYKGSSKSDDIPSK